MIVAAVSFPIEAVYLALSGPKPPSERGHLSDFELRLLGWEDAKPKAEREFDKRTQGQQVNAEQRRTETEKAAMAMLDRKFLEAETKEKIMAIAGLFVATLVFIVLILLSSELLQVLLDISRNTQDLVEAQRIPMESHDVR